MGRAAPLARHMFKDMSLVEIAERCADMGWNFEVTYERPDDRLDHRGDCPGPS
jgi:hypothetical protein